MASTCAPRARRPLRPTQRATTWQAPLRTPDGTAHQLRLAAGASVAAVAESCGTSRKTITSHYHEDLGDDFERPYPPFEQQLSRARVWMLRASGSLERRRPRRSAARPVITTGSARSGQGPSHSPAPSIAASAPKPTSSRARPCRRARRPRAALRRRLTVVLAGGAGVAALLFAAQQLRRSVSFLCRQHRRLTQHESSEAAICLQNALLAQLVEHFHGKGMRRLSASGVQRRTQADFQRVRAALPTS